MFSKIVALCGLVIVCQAGLLPAAVHYSPAEAVSSQNIVRHDQPPRRLALAAPVTYQSAPALLAHSAPILSRAEHFDAHPKYEYTYSIADSHTGDNKSQQESRDGDVVKGSYSFHEADGSVRTVEYTADDHNGFNAVVHNTAPTAAPAYLKAVPAYIAAPTQYYHH